MINFNFTAEAQIVQRKLFISFAFERKANEIQSTFGRKCVGN
jgi:hypothetical protein